MHLDNEWYDYLYDRKFSNGIKFSVRGKTNKLYSRLDLLMHLTENKKIIHLGACDHIPLIENKIKNNQWLHKLLMEKCNTVIGIDIAKDAVDFCQNLGWKNIYHYDMTKDSAEIIQLINQVIDINKGEKMDYIVAGEIIEHLPNPVSFLEQINKLYSKYVDKIIITVPNILYYKYMLWSFKGLEHNNTDHKYWFTPYTAAKILTCAGMHVTEILFMDGAGGKISSLLRRFLKNQMIFSTSLICIAELKMQE